MIPKFRAWWKSEQTMISLVDWIDFKREQLIGKIEEQTILPVKFDDIILMQSIERKDINDIDIFCDDIVKDFQGNLFQVKYWSEYSSYFLTPITELDKPMGIYPNIILEVIGNIWEDGDLIDNKKSETD